MGETCSSLSQPGASHQRPCVVRFVVRSCLQAHPGFGATASGRKTACGNRYRWCRNMLLVRLWRGPVDNFTVGYEGVRRRGVVKLDRTGGTHLFSWGEKTTMTRWWCVIRGRGTPGQPRRMYQEKYARSRTRALIFPRGNCGGGCRCRNPRNMVHIIVVFQAVLVARVWAKPTQFP